jgi:hypothetical protein
VAGRGWASTTTPAPATSAQARSARLREVARATLSGPRNSSVTARPRPSRATAVYRDKFMVPKMTASASTGRHCGQPNERQRGRPAARSAIAAIHWRTATTPSGPMTGKASAPVAAPTWLDRAPPNMARVPARSGVTVISIPPACAAASYT